VKRVLDAEFGFLAEEERILCITLAEEAGGRVCEELPRRGAGRLIGHRRGHPVYEAAPEWAGQDHGFRRDTEQ